MREREREMEECTFLLSLLALEECTFLLSLLKFLVEFSLLFVILIVNLVS